jgi:amino acid carrier protein
MDSANFITAIHDWVASLGGIVWGPYCLLPLLVGTGIYLVLGLKFLPWRYIGPAFMHMWRGRRANEDHSGELSPFKAMMTCMAATIGTGNIVGVATAIMIGGPGAVFWMWVTGALGMATKYAEAVLAVKYREVTPSGDYVGGPMYYIKNGLGQGWKWMAFLFAVFGMVASFGIGNMTQCNAITGNLSTAFNIPPEAVAIALFVIVGIVLVGGVKRIGDVAGVVVPFMAVAYIILGIVIMFLNYDKVGPAFLSIFQHAFAPAPAAGGFVGATIVMAMRYGMARGLFSNEAGLGSGPIAHATAITNNPVRQGFLGMIDPFIDTILVCSMTAIIILISGDWTAVDRGTAAVMTSHAFGHALPGMGQYFVAVALVLFAFTTILGWCVYGERCAMYLFGHKALKPFRLIFTLVVPIGALMELAFVWDLSDLFNGLMALPNLIALLLLSPVVFKMTREYFEKHNRDNMFDE